MILPTATVEGQGPSKQEWAKFFEPREFSDGNKNTLHYRLMKPFNYDPNRKYPLVLFLHGAGERGSDNEAQLKHGMKEFLDPELRENFPCYVLAPQCPEGKKWVEVDWSTLSHEMPEKASIPLQLAVDVVRSMIESSGVDKTRIYITGLSMGGYGTWDAVARFPNMFAAAIPICGGGDPATANRFAKLPLWAFHGDQDKAVPVERSRTMIASLKSQGGDPKYTEYPGVGHDSWSATYANREVLRWMFAQRRKLDSPTEQ